MPFLSKVGAGPESVDPFDNLGQLGQVLNLFPEGRSAVTSMEAKVLHEGILNPAVRALVAAVGARNYADTMQFERHL